MKRGYEIGNISIPIKCIAFAVKNTQLLNLAPNDCRDPLLAIQEDLLEQDILNAGACILYLIAQHPHATLILQPDSIRVGNLTLNERIDCLSQAAFRFSFCVLNSDGSELKVYEYR